MEATKTPSSAGKLCELARYTVGGEDRHLLGQRVDGEVRVFDCPRERGGRSYFVESGFESKKELAAMLAEYRRQAEILGFPPMSRKAIGRALGAGETRRAER